MVIRVYIIINLLLMQKKKKKICLVLYSLTHGSRRAGKESKLRVWETNKFLLYMTAQVPVSIYWVPPFCSPEDVRVLLHYMPAPAQQELLPWPIPLQTHQPLMSSGHFGISDIILY